MNLDDIEEQWRRKADRAHRIRVTVVVVISLLALAAGFAWDMLVIATVVKVGE